MKDCAYNAMEEPTSVLTESEKRLARDALSMYPQRNLGDVEKCFLVSPYIPIYRVFRIGQDGGQPKNMMALVITKDTPQGIN